MANHTLRVIAPPPARSPEREELARQIARYDAVRADIMRITEARKRLRDDVLYPAQRAADEAAEALGKTNAQAAEYLAAEFLGETERGASLRELKKAADDAKVAIADAEKISEGLAARLTAAEQTLYWATSGREDALTKVIRTSPELAALIAVYESKREELLGLRSTLASIGLSRMPGRYDFQVPPIQRPIIPDAKHQAWLVAIGALLTDADAVLPA